MKQCLLLLISSLIAQFTFAQTSMLGLTRDEVITEQEYKKSSHIMRESITDGGKPYISYDLKEGIGGVSFYFESDLCVEYRIILSENDIEMLLRNLREHGYVFEKGAWFNNESQMIALVNKKEGIVIASFMTFEYFLASS